MSLKSKGAEQESAMMDVFARMEEQALLTQLEEQARLVRYQHLVHSLIAN